MTEHFRYTFKLESIKLDTREYRQDSDMFLPHTPLYVSVDLPREKEYVLNLAEIIQAELASDNKGIPEPVLSPKGYAYVKKQLESGFELPKLEVTEDEWTETEKKLEPSKAAPKNDWVDPEWGNTVDDKNKVNEETWEDEKETWE